MPANLTKEKLIQTTSPDSPIPNHYLVIFKKQGEGEVFHKIIDPGNVFRIDKRLIFGPKMESYLAYAVTADQDVSHDFSREYEHDGMHHIFILKIQMKIRVKNPRHIAESMNFDPLRKLEDYAAQLLNNQVQEYSWDRIVKSSVKDFDYAVMHDKSPVNGELKSNLEHLKNFAENAGFEIISISIKRSLLEDDLSNTYLEDQKKRELEKKKIESFYDTQIVAIDIQEKERINEQERKNEIGNEKHQNMLSGFRRQRELLDTIVNSTEKVINQIGSHIEGIADIKEVIHEIRAIRPEIQQLVYDDSKQLGIIADSSANSIQQMPSEMNLMGSTKQPVTDVLVELLQESFNVVDGLQISQVEKRKLFVAILHLLGELSLVDQSDKASIEIYSKVFDEQFKKVAQDMHEKSLDFMQRLKNHDTLIEELKQGL